jgi:uncharacterized protein YbjT (DUF2867 family)
MNAVVVGASGLIGGKLVRTLGGRGHRVVSASLSSGVDVLSGQGLAEALHGAQVVVDVTNSPSFEDGAVMHFFQTASRNILATERSVDVSHHIALSVVGTERLQASGYFRAKLAQEELIKASAIPFTILRSTQFFEFLNGIAQSATAGTTVRLPPALVQPVMAEDVATVLADLVEAVPANGTVELAGPEAMRLDELVRLLFQATNDPRTVVTDGHASYFGAELDHRSLTPGPNARLGRTRFSDWVKDTMIQIRPMDFESRA